MRGVLIPRSRADSVTLTCIHSFWFWKRIFGDNWHRFSYWPMPFLSPSKQCQNTAGNSKHQSQPAAFPHSFFIHYWNPEWKCTVPFTPVFWCQYPHWHQYTITITVRPKLSCRKKITVDCWMLWTSVVVKTFFKNSRPTP